jgi:Uma2 family endonuclease
MTTTRRYTSADLESLPDVEGVRYEIIGGELHVSTAPGRYHQYASDQARMALQLWNDRTGRGMAVSGPGLIFADDDEVVPDVVWISRERLATGLDHSGHLRVAPELVVEVLSPGSANVRRDREKKLDLYSRRGVDEYWIVDGQGRAVQVYRREQADLRLVATLGGDDALTTPLLPSFACPVGSLWTPPL